MTILDGFVRGRSATARLIYVVALCSMLFACGGGGNGSEPPPVSTTPSITTQPANQTVNVGQAATFSVTANGTAPLSYQWQKGGVAISGATSASYTTPVTQASDNGTTFTVTVTNAAGSVPSSAATLTVTAMPIPQTSLSCAGYPNTLQNTTQNYTRVCLILPVESAQVTPGVNVTSESGGDITAHGTGPSDLFFVYARVIAQAADQGTATSLAQSVVVTITPDGKISSSADHENLPNPETLSVDFEIFTLGSTNVTSNSAGGNLAADHYNATLNLTTAGGDIKLATVQGNVTANSSGGNINLDTVQGTVMAKSDGGTIQFGTVSGNVTANSSGGDINLDTVNGDVTATTDGGSMQLDTVNGNITATTGGGSIGITLTGTGWTGQGLSATTQGGSILLTRPASYQAAFTAQTTSGTASIDGKSETGPPDPAKVTAGSGAPITLESDSGNVAVTVAQ